MNKFTNKALVALFSVFLIFTVFLPLTYFISLAFYSGVEAFEFPQSLLPKLYHKLHVKYSDTEYSVTRVTREEEKELIRTNKISKIRVFFGKELSIEITNDELEKEFKKAKENPDGFTKVYRKNILYNFKRFFKLVTKAGPGLRNSLIAAAWTIIISLTIGGIAGYTLARYRFKIKEQVSLSLLLVRMFPTVALAIPMVVILRKAGFTDTMLGLAIIYSVPNIALTAWITNSIFVGVSEELEEASQVFGATKFQTILKITLPLALPGLIASSMYAFLAAWNDTIVALILLEEKETLALSIYKALNTSNSNPHLMAAGSLILIIPALIFTFIIKGYMNQMWGEAKV